LTSCFSFLVTVFYSDISIATYVKKVKSVENFINYLSLTPKSLGLQSAFGFN